MFNTIMKRIESYHKEKDGYPHWKRSDEWFEIFQTIRKYMYADFITLDEYDTLMDTLGID